MKQKTSIVILLLAAVIIAVAAGWVALRPAPMAPPVAIQDGKTIDFSSGQPVVKNSPQEKAIIDAAVKEMDAAARDVTFGPAVPPPDEKKKAESTGIPPKP